MPVCLRRDTVIAALFLAGLPGLAMAEGKPLQCSAVSVTDAYEISYDLFADVKDGRLVPTEGTLIGLRQHPLVEKFAPGYSVYIAQPRTDGQFNDDDTYVVQTMGESPYGPTLAVKLNAPNLPKKAHLKLTTGKDAPPVTESDVDVVALENQVVSMLYFFDAKANLATQSGKFALTVEFDGQPVAFMGFDLTTIPWQDFKKATDAQFLSASGIVINPDGSTNLPGCAVWVDMFGSQ